MVMNYRGKKMVPLLALLLFVTASAPAWSAEEGQEDQAAASETAGETEASAPEQEAVKPDPPPAPEASEPPPGDAANAPEDGSEHASEADKAEVLQSSFDPADWLVYKPLWYLTSLVGDFNPVGKHISTPLEEKFPGLRVKGFLNSITQINTTSTNHNAGPFGRDKDWRLQKQEFRAQLELKYQANENIELVSVSNFQYDGAYQFQDTDGLYRDGSSNQIYYTQGKRIFKEAYVRGNYGKVNFTLGKQIVNWGKMDGKVIDIINAEDSRDAIQYYMKDYEWRYIGQWMANVSVRPVENLTLNLLVNPDFQPNQGSAIGSPYSLAPKGTNRGTPEIVRHGYNDIKDMELGFRADTTIGALSISGIYYYGFDRDSVFSRDQQAYIHTRQHKFGYAADYATTVFGQRLVIRSEGLYTRGKSYAVADAPHGLLDKDTLKLALAFETSIFSDENKIDILYQPIWTQQINYDSRTGVQRVDVLHVVNISHSVRKTNDRLTLSATGYIPSNSTYSGFSYNVAAGWKFNDHLKAQLAYYDFQGKDSDLPWGAYNKWKNVELNVKYEF